MRLLAAAASLVAEEAGEPLYDAEEESAGQREMDEGLEACCCHVPA